MLMTSFEPMHIGMAIVTLNHFTRDPCLKYFLAQVMDTLGRGPNSRGSQKYRWVTTYELSCLTDKLNHQVGSNVVFDLSTMDCNLRDHRICFVSTILVFQVATLGTYGNRCNRSRHYVFPPSLIRYLKNEFHRRTYDNL